MAQAKPHRFILLCVGILVLALTPSSFAADDDEATAVTVWWIVFNDPTQCLAGPGACNLPDLFNPEVMAGVFHATGNVSDEDGNVILVSSLYESPASVILPGPAPPFGNALLDANAAEIHVVVRSHGPVIRRFRDLQISQFLEPGCSDLGGPNTCVDIQFAVHPADGGTYSKSNVFRFDDGRRVRRASSQLWRYDDYVTVVIRTKVPVEDDD